MASNLLEAARRYLAAGFSLIPCTFKKADFGWQQYQIKPPTLREVNHWFDPEFDKGNLSIGVILGAVSHNVVAIDLDGIEPMRLFDSIFHHLTDTRIVISGSGKGAHLYYRVANLPENINVRASNGGFEIRGNGQYVIAPPSPHPSGKFYTVYRNLPIKQVDNLNDVWDWFNAMRQDDSLRQEEITQAARPVQVQAAPNKQKILKLIFSETVAQVRVSVQGNRNVSLFRASLRLANYASGGEFHWHDCEAELLAAALSVGMGENEARRTIASAWKIGSRNPKKVK
jgi:hypothetical protein